jgi:hypothetical protein
MPAAVLLLGRAAAESASVRPRTLAALDAAARRVEAPLLGAIAHKLGGVGRRAGDVAAVLRAGHLAAAPLAMSFAANGAGEAPRAVIASTLGFPLIPVAVRPGGPAGLPVGRPVCRPAI